MWYDSLFSAWVWIRMSWADNLHEKETGTFSGSIWDCHLFTLPSWSHWHFHFWATMQPANDGKSRVKKISLFLSETAICLLVQVWQTRIMSQMTCFTQRATEGLGLFSGFVAIYSSVKAKQINNKIKNEWIKIITKYKFDLRKDTKICWQLEGSCCSNVYCLLPFKQHSYASTFVFIPDSAKCPEYLSALCQLLC